MIRNQFLFLKIRYWMQDKGANHDLRLNRFSSPLAHRSQPPVGSSVLDFTRPTSSPSLRRSTCLGANGPYIYPCLHELGLCPTLGVIRLLFGIAPYTWPALRFCSQRGGGTAPQETERLFSRPSGRDALRLYAVSEGRRQMSPLHDWTDHERKLQGRRRTQRTQIALRSCEFLQKGKSISLYI